jgi:DNA polymerase III gamma/tau subunit
MTFEEFFKKKKIDLVALEQGEQSLFSEFKTHYEQMGEKSFDHTKKYWFNKLRRQFPAAPEIKTEKVIIENQLAEQTITESLIELGTPAPKLGFAPKFRAPNVTKPAEEKTETKAAETMPPVENTATKPAFKPRFQAGMMKPKAADSETSATEKPEAKGEDTTPATEAAKPAYKPRFQAGMAKPKPTENETTPEENKTEDQEKTEISAETPAAKPAYKPRFQPGMVKSKPVENEEKPVEKTEEKPDTPPAADEATAKPAYKPRFNMKNIPPKPDQE